MLQQSTVSVSSKVSVSRISEGRKPTFSFEYILWCQGYSFIIGVDEVGRGALAGPVVAGACILLASQDTVLQKILRLGIDDSKRLSAKQRGALAPEIQKYFHCAVGEASVAEINRYGIVAATRKAMRRAIRKLIRHPERPEGVEGRCQTVPPEGSRSISGKPTGFFAPLRMTYLLLDGGFPLSHCPGFPSGRQQAIVRGDQLSVTIAAASIIAKVYRDGLMKQLADGYASYCWSENKGYGTDKHLQALRQWGHTPHHRLSFIKARYVP